MRTPIKSNNGSRLGLFFLLTFLLGGFCANAAKPQIIAAHNASAIERYAAKELQRYLYQLSGEFLEIQPETAKITGPSFVVGQPSNLPWIAALQKQGELAISKTDPGEQGYILKKISSAGQPVIVIAAASDIGCLYGVYGLLQDHYGVAFYFDGDVLPGRKAPLAFPNVNERKNPAVAIRGFLPWTNFPQSATSYSWEDWKFIIDQMAKMRLNFLHIHNYNGECGHNEMFHNVSYQGSMPPVWMATARSGHAWGGRPGCDPNRYLFGAHDLFDDYDFGADCARHNENLFNHEAFRKGVSEFQKVIAYAHTRGVKIGLGLDIDVLPVELREKKLKADDPEIVSNRINQIIADYPNLDYLLCFQSEGIHADKERYRAWRNVFDGFYKALKTRVPQMRVAVAGWGIRADDVASLPADVICAPISHYSDGCENGAIYGNREYWGCPWLERDFNSSEYYYPYNLHLSNTIKAWQGRAPNMKGFYCLTWRLTDAISPKISYMAKAPWDSAGKYDSSEAVYRDFAEVNYGKKGASEITQIINQNEPFALGFGECQATPAFDQAATTGGYLVNIHTFSVHPKNAAGTPRIAAESNAQNGTRTAPCTEGGLCVGFIEHGHWLRFDGVDFGTGADLFEARVAAAGPGGLIDLRLDSLEGTQLGICQVDNSGEWQNWQTSKIAIKPTSGKHTLFLKFLAKQGGTDEFAKAEAQLKVIDRCITQAETPAQQARLRLLRCRIAAAKDHIALNRNFNNYDWKAFPGALPSWVSNFTYRVTDISSLGNVVSAENRFVQVNYAGGKVQDLRKTLKVQPPSRVTARGTKNGATITWQNREEKVAGFHVYRDGKRLNPSTLPATQTNWLDQASGSFTYTVTALAQSGEESLPSVPLHCAAGSADKTAPHIVVISPPASAQAGQPIWVTARILEDRAYEFISAQLCYRVMGEKFWHSKTMERRTKAVFCASLPSVAPGCEYYIRASDGMNEAFFPVSAPTGTLTCVVEEGWARAVAPSAPGRVVVANRTLAWNPVPNAFWYRIYRSQDPRFQPGPENFLTWVAAPTTAFKDNGEDFASKPLSGPWYYRITATTSQDQESKPTEPAAVRW